MLNGRWTGSQLYHPYTSWAWARSESGFTSTFWAWARSKPVLSPARVPGHGGWAGHVSSWQRLAPPSLLCCPLDPRVGLRISSLTLTPHPGQGEELRKRRRSPDTIAGKRSPGTAMATVSGAMGTTSLPNWSDSFTADSTKNPPNRGFEPARARLSLNLAMHRPASGASRSVFNKQLWELPAALCRWRQTQPAGSCSERPGRSQLCLRAWQSGHRQNPLPGHHVLVPWTGPVSLEGEWQTCYSQRLRLSLLRKGMEKPHRRQSRLKSSKNHFCNFSDYYWNKGIKKISKRICGPLRKYAQFLKCPQTSFEK